jgi:hypothetical protein
VLVIPRSNRPIWFQIIGIETACCDFTDRNRSRLTTSASPLASDLIDLMAFHRRSLPTPTHPRPWQAALITESFRHRAGHHKGGSAGAQAEPRISFGTELCGEWPKLCVFDQMTSLLRFDSYFESLRGAMMTSSFEIAFSHKYSVTYENKPEDRAPAAKTQPDSHSVPDPNPSLSFERLDE